MEYQDKKIKAIARLTVMAAAITVLLVISLVYPNPTRNIVQHLPLSRYGDDYGVWLGVLAVMAPLIWVVDVALIFTSPEQEVRFVQWLKRWRKTPLKFEEIDFDTLDPDYRKVAWRYVFDRYKR